MWRYPTPIRRPSGMGIRRPSDTYPTPVRRRCDAIKRFAVVSMPIQRSGRQIASFLKPHGQAVCSGPHSWTPKPPEAPAGRPSDINGPRGVHCKAPGQAMHTPSTLRAVKNQKDAFFSNNHETQAGGFWKPTVLSAEAQHVQLFERRQVH